MILSSFSLGVSYAFVHAFQVSKQGRVMSFSVLSSPHHGTGMLVLLILLSILWQMADWTFEKALAAIKSPPSISLDTLVSPVGLRSGGHPFC